MEDYEHIGVETIVCPHCGYKLSDPWDLVSDSGELECDECGFSFFYERERDITYSTTKD